MVDLGELATGDFIVLIENNTGSRILTFGNVDQTGPDEELNTRLFGGICNILSLLDLDSCAGFLPEVCDGENSVSAGESFFDR